MNAKLTLTGVQILLGVLLSCVGLIKQPAPQYSATKTVPDSPQSQSIPFAPFILLAGGMITCKGLWDLYQLQLGMDEPFSEAMPERVFEGRTNVPHSYTPTQSQPVPQQSPNFNSEAFTEYFAQMPSVNSDSFESIDLSKLNATSEQIPTPIATQQSTQIQAEGAPAPAAYAYPETIQTNPEPTLMIHEIPLRQTLRENKLSWVLCGPPGVGKTTALLAWIADTITTSPGVRFFINGWKNDAWLGLAKLPGVFKRNAPDRRTGMIDFSGFFQQVQAVASILHARLELPEDQRDGLSRVWLVLDDFFATSDALNKAKGLLAEQWEIAKSQIGQIITLGREVGVGLCAGTHSFNVKALGLDDANIRGCLGICALGKIYWNAAGRREGGYDTITNVLKNKYIIPPESLSFIAPVFNALKSESERAGHAIALTTFGEAQIGLFVEDLAWVKSYQIPIAQESETSQVNVIPFPHPEIDEENLWELN